MNKPLTLLLSMWSQLKRLAAPALIELAAITLIGLIYISFSIPFDSTERISGLEHERLAGVVLPFEIGLRRYGHLPTWNPYIGLGEPTFNNPFNYLLNPFASLPVLAFGGFVGTKISTAIGLLIAGYNMWALAKALGLGGAARVTAGSLYLLSGGLAAKFYIGHFQLGLSLAWPPLVLAGLWWTLHSADRRAPVLMAVAFMLLFFTGNIYYTLHTLICCSFIMLIHLVDREDKRWRWRPDRLKRVAVGGAFALGLAMPQFITNWAIRDFIYHSTDPLLDSRYDLGRALVNFTFPWGDWSIFERPEFNMIAGVDYAYIGAGAFLLMVALTLALLISPSVRARLPVRAAFAAVALASFMMVWGAGQTIFIQWPYANIQLLSEWRFVGRAHSIAALWWIVLAGLSVDALWKTAREVFKTPLNFDAYDRARLLRVMLLSIGVWVWFLVYSLEETTTSQRLGMVRNNTSLLNLFDQYRFTTFSHVISGLFVFILALLLIDSILLVFSRLFTPLLDETAPERYGLSWHAVGTRFFRLGVLLAALTTLADAAQVNSRLFAFIRYDSDFSPAEEYVLAHDDENPFPAIHQGHSPFAFSNYHHETRSWYLNEGWIPSALPSIIPFENGEIQDLPRWAVVWSDQGRDLSENFVQAYDYQSRLCIPIDTFGQEVSDPCNLDIREAMIVFEKPDVLPYAFSAAVETIVNAPGTIQRDNVGQAKLIAHQQDTIIIYAEMLLDEEPRHLIVQETHFPGWTATIDGVPAPTVTVGRYIGVPMQPGARTYTLRFEPPGFAIGIITFIVTVLVIGFYLRGKKL